MSKKKTIEQFIEDAKLIHGDKYDYSKVNYISALKKVIIICKIHGEFQQQPTNHCCQKQGCPKCVGRNRTSEEFVKKAIQIHGDKYDYSKVDYINSNTKITIICKTHGEFNQTPNSHLLGQGCQICGDVNGSLKRSKSTKEFIQNAKEVHGDKYDYSKVDYINNKTKITIICKTHGEFNQTPNSHLLGQGCRKCQYSNNSNKFRTSQEEFIQKAQDLHGDKYDYSKVEYITCMKKVIIICKKHGEFKQTPNAHYSQCSGCPKCNLQHHISKLQIHWLDFTAKIHNLTIQHGENGEEFKIPSTRFKSDGYCKETNTIYEFHGDYWHGNPNIYEPNKETYFGKTFGELYEKTLKREQHIKDIGFNLITIWESDWIKLNKCVRILQRKYRNSKLH
jgi:G:T-mismatch repair DNA endonuclease (very short patch repair protein)